MGFFDWLGGSARQGGQAAGNAAGGAWNGIRDGAQGAWGAARGVWQPEGEDTVSRNQAAAGAMTGWQGRGMWEQMKDMFGGSGVPAPPDFVGMAGHQGNMAREDWLDQTAANRASQSSAFGQSIWHRNPDGSWRQESQLSEPMQGIFNQLAGQSQNSLREALDNGATARQRAEDAHFQRASSRLDPMWQQREAQMRTRLENQGFAPNDEAAQSMTAALGRERNDAYANAMNDSIIFGGAEGQRAQQMDLTSRMAPFQQLMMLQQALQMPDYHRAGMAQTPDLVGALGQAYGAQVGAANANNANRAGMISAGLEALPAILKFFE